MKGTILGSVILAVAIVGAAFWLGLKIDALRSEVAAGQRATASSIASACSTLTQPSTALNVNVRQVDQPVTVDVRK